MPRPKRAQAKDRPLFAGEVFARRLYEVRKRRGWSQTELAERLEDYGRKFHRTTIAKLETPGHSRARNVPLEDVLAIAAVLGVAPVHLFVPLEDDARLRLFEKPGEILRDKQGEPRRDDEGRILRRDDGVVNARVAREWVRGYGMVGSPNVRLFFAEQPEREREAILQQSKDAPGPGEPIGADYFEPTTDQSTERPGDADDAPGRDPRGGTS